MAQTFLKADVILAVALERLRRELILPRLVTRMGIENFRGAKDDTVNVRVPTLLNAREYTWRTRGAAIVVDEITEDSIPVVLNKHVYSALQVTDEELTLDIRDFTTQVLEPQVIGVAEKLESYIATAMSGATYEATDVAYAEGTADGFYKALVDARQVLNDAHVPITGRVALVGSDIEAAALKEEALRDASQSGSTEALRAATIGRIAGFDVVASQSVASNFGVAFHPSAFVFAQAAPEVPSGASYGASRTESGLALRWLRDYDPSYLRDRSVLSAFAGAAAVGDARDPDSGGQPGPINDKVLRAVKIAFTPAT